ncbi:MAG: UDP-N-acetylmuramate dehydrogenase [Candidatus Rokuibacteriota bacterium]
MTGEPQQAVDLARHCTMGVGGPARYFVEAHDLASVLLALDWTRRRGLPLRVLGGGSNLLVADDGVDGLVLKVALRGLSLRESAGAVELTAAAGEPWDGVVCHAVERGWAGLECLSGIPGLVGATPIQNVGAYGQEVSNTVAAVRVLDRTSARIVTLGPAACGFAYRDSALKSREPERYVVLAVTYRLRPGGVPTVTYPDIERHLADRGVRTPTLGEVRTSVLAVRRGKSMVLDPDDENRRSCGSFFLNPILPAEAAAQVAERAAAAAPGVAMPSWREGSGRVKLSAAWLIERAGFARGEREGPVGLSTRHTLAIVCHDGARAADVAAFARRVRARVEARFGVRLVPEPVFWGGLTLD